MHIPVFLALVLCLLTGCGMNGKEPITSFEQLGKAGTAIGVGSDLPQWKTLQEDYPEAEVIAITDKPLAYEDVAKIQSLSVCLLSRRSRISRKR